MDKRNIDPRKARYERLKKRKNLVDLDDFDIKIDLQRKRNPDGIANQI